MEKEAPTTEEEGTSIQKRRKNMGKITPKLYDKASKIILYLSKIIL